MSCDLKKNVSWTINKDKINKILLNKKNGLLWSSVEHAGEIFFDNYNCKEDICDKKINNITFKNGNSDSVMTPLSVINFHTHPLSCYIEAETIWGWPSGEDLKECINFAKHGNLTHIIFAVEGTYIIDVNKKLLKSLTDKFKNLIEKLFQYTHKFRMYYNDSDYSLEEEFETLYLKPVGLKFENNLQTSWLSLINNLNLYNLNILVKHVKISKDDIFGKSGISIKNKEYIYNITFIPNKTIQWSNTSKDKIFQKLKNCKITLPDKIIYSAPFISKDCKIKY